MLQNPAEFNKAVIELFDGLRSDRRAFLSRCSENRANAAGACVTSRTLEVSMSRARKLDSLIVAGCPSQWRHYLGTAGAIISEC